MKADGLVWTINAARYPTMIFRTSLLCSIKWTTRCNGNAQSRAFLCRNRRSLTTNMFYPLTSIKRLSTFPWGIRPPVRFSPSCARWRRRFRKGWKNWRGWCNSEIGGAFTTPWVKTGNLKEKMFRTILN